VTYLVFGALAVALLWWWLGPPRDRRSDYDNGFTDGIAVSTVVDDLMDD
jgi:hypothetical protein